MNTARDIIGRLLQGTGEYETSSLNQDLCRVLDISMGCLEEPDPPKSTSSVAGSCPRLWSVDMCWPSAPFNTTKTQPCRNFDNSSAISDDVVMYCNATSQSWDMKSSSHSCIVGMILSNLNQSDIGNSSDYLDYSESDDITASALSSSDYALYESGQMNSDFAEVRRYATLGRFVTVGHALSLASLAIAILLLAMLRRLHCTRIYIHMNLMAAFVLRGLLWLLHMIAFQDSNSAEEQVELATLQLTTKVLGMYTASDLTQLRQWKKELCFTQYNYVWCRSYYVLQNYSVTANYYWILVEGLYLCLLLRATVFSHTKYMKGFLVLGWVLPWLSVIGSVLAKLLDPRENNACWWEDKNSAYWWIIKVPIILSLVINFGIFMMVVTVVGSKLKVTHRHRADEVRDDYKWRLTKSTLALIPLLGIQYIVTVFFGVVKIKDPTAEFTRYALEVSFSSVQGLLVAFIYCFFNGEVQDECKKKWKHWKVKWELSKREQNYLREQRRKKATTNTSLTNIYTYYLSRKSSAVSTASTRPGYWTSRPSNQEDSPGRQRYCTSTLDDITERSPRNDVRMTRVNGLRTTSLNGNASSLTSLNEGMKNSNRLSIPLIASQFNPSHQTNTANIAVPDTRPTDALVSNETSLKYDDVTPPRQPSDGDVNANDETSALLLRHNDNGSSAMEPSTSTKQEKV